MSSTLTTRVWLCFSCFYVSGFATGAAFGDSDTERASQRNYRLVQTERGQATESTAQSPDTAAAFDIRSPSGIGRLVITPIAKQAGDSKAWPANITLRLYLRNLALVELDNGKQTIASAALRGPQPRACYVTSSTEPAKQRQQKEVADDHPLFLSVRHVSPKSGAAKSDDSAVDADEPDQGYFEVRLPRAFLKDAPAKLRVRWIDFYRG